MCSGRVPSEIETAVVFSDATVLCGGMLVVCVVGGAALLDSRRVISVTQLQVA